MARGDIPQIEWGDTSPLRTISFGLPLDSPLSWSRSADGSETVVADSGARDGWITGTVYLLSGVVRFIPTSDVTAASNPDGRAVTGWDGNEGWRAFLEWVRAGNEFRFYPDKTDSTTDHGFGANGYFECSLDDPDVSPQPEPTNLTRRLSIVLTNLVGPYEGY